MRCIVVGSEDINNPILIKNVITKSDFPITEIISNNLEGVGKNIQKYATKTDVDLVVFPVNWRKYKKDATQACNKRMVKYLAEDKSRPGGLIVIWFGLDKRIRNLLEIVQDTDIRVFKYRLKPESKNLIGKKFGNVTILDIFMKPNSRRRYSKYRCDCGKENQIRLSDIVSGIKISCGCLSGLPPGESSIRRVISEYKGNAKVKGRCFTLTDIETRRLLLSSCYYCGNIPDRIINDRKLKGKIVVSGIDRKDNDMGYTTKNCVSCCKACNYKKGSSLLEDFLKWVKKVYENLSLDDE